MADVQLKAIEIELEWPRLRAVEIELPAAFRDELPIQGESPPAGALIPEGLVQ